MKKIIRTISLPITVTTKVFNAAYQLVPSKQTVVESAASIKKGVYKKVVVPFLPKYEVVFTMYNVIPGKAVDTKESAFNFEKGARTEAEDFYNKLINSTSSYKIMPSEIQLKKGKKVVEAKAFGPVSEIKGMMIN